MVKRRKRKLLSISRRDLWDGPKNNCFSLGSLPLEKLKRLYEKCKRQKNTNQAEYIYGFIVCRVWKRSPEFNKVVEDTILGFIEMYGGTYTHEVSWYLDIPWSYVRKIAKDMHKRGLITRNGRSYEKHNI